MERGIKIAIVASLALATLSGCLVDLKERRGLVAVNGEAFGELPPAFLVATARGAEQVVATINSTTCPTTPNNLFWLPDGPPRGFRDQHGLFRLITPHLMTYAFVGTSLEDIGPDCTKVVS